MKKFEDTLKRICKFYSFSPKRREELKRFASFLDENLKMHTEIKAIRWVSSQQRALEAVCQDINVTVTHMEQILETSYRADELGQAKAILTDLKSVKFVKYIHHSHVRCTHSHNQFQSCFKIKICCCLR